MFYLFILFVFSLVCYAGTEMIVYLNGPFHIFEKFRGYMEDLGGHFGELVHCEACTSTWMGFFISALNYLIIPAIPFTPFNIILSGTGLWWIIILLDGLYGCGISWLLFRLEDFLTINSQTNEENDNGQGTNA